MCERAAYVSLLKISRVRYVRLTESKPARICSHTREKIQLAGSYKKKQKGVESLAAAKVFFLV
jgi:hypothetical protein